MEQTKSHLDLTNDLSITELPDNLTVTRLTVRGCKNLRHLPHGLKAFAIDASESGIVSVPDDIQVANELNLTSCTQLTRLPDNLHVGTLTLMGCTALITLPKSLRVDFLDISNCPNLIGWGEDMQMGVGRLTARSCPWLTELPSSCTHLAQLDLAGCANLTHLPEGLRVASWLDIADTNVTQLPAPLLHTRLRWRGVLVDARVVFAPETITGQEVLATTNTEVRRVMLERMGIERFISDVKPQVLDEDKDPGGKRQLLRVPLVNDEDVVCLAVGCPSTGRQYLLRVPPSIQQCHQAAAWIAGFDNANDYAPLLET
jgi:hypothetical protein